MENINATMLDKFGGLVSYLTQTKSAFEIVADEIEDCNLKTAFNGLSADSLQYANELTTQLRTLGIHYEFSSSLPDSGFSYDNAEQDITHERGDEVLLLCSSSENNIIKAYREILNEYFPFQALREVMTCQLNTLILSFMKIRLLNLTRFSVIH